MTKKDYIKFAELLVNNYEDVYCNEGFMADLYELFSEDNNNFDADRFDQFVHKHYWAGKGYEVWDIRTNWHGRLFYRTKNTWRK